MAGEQREFLVVVEDRGARLRVVIGEAEPLGKLLVEAREPQRIGVWIADRGYDAQKRVLDRIAACGGEAVIPSRQHRLRPRAHDRWQYRARHLIENFFARLKQYRAIATRYDKTACNFLGAIHLAASVIWLN